MALFRKTKDSDHGSHETESGALPAPAAPIMVLEDLKNRVELWPTKLTIRRHGMLNTMNLGMSGDKDIYLHTITGIQLKKPGLASGGYIQFVTMGGQEGRGGILGATKDENAVLFSRGKSYEVASELKERVEAMIAEQRAPAASVAALSLADELGKLAALRDAGVLTSEEFSDHKAALLQRA